MKTASWILRNKETKEVICETFDPAKVAALNTEKYEAVPIQEYLVSLNEPTDADCLSGLRNLFVGVEK